MSERLRLTVLGICLLAGMLIDGSVPIVEQSTQDSQPVPIVTNTDAYLSTNCYEDESVVIVVSAYDGRYPFHFDPGEPVCAAYDDLNTGRRPHS